MSTHNIQHQDKIRKNPYIFVFLSYWKNFVGTEKRVRIIHGKRAIRVRAIEVILYFKKQLHKKNKGQKKHDVFKILGHLLYTVESHKTPFAQGSDKSCYGQPWYSRLSLSQIPRDSLKYFVISVPRHQICRIEEKIIQTTTSNKYICNWSRRLIMEYFLRSFSPFR